MNPSSQQASDLLGALLRIEVIKKETVPIILDDIKSRLNTIKETSPKEPLYFSLSCAMHLEKAVRPSIEYCREPSREQSTAFDRATYVFSLFSLDKISRTCENLRRKKIIDPVLSSHLREIKRLAEIEASRRYKLDKNRIIAMARHGEPTARSTP